jgi:hypothetical protein
MNMYKVFTIMVVLASATLVMALQGKGDSAGSKEAIEKSVLEANARMLQASNSMDTEKFFDFILDSDKGPVIQDGQLFKTRAEAMEFLRAGFQRIAKIDRQYNQTYVTVLSPEAALLTATGSFAATLSDGRTLTNPFAVSLIFVLRNGQWKVLHGHYSVPNQ